MINYRVRIKNPVFWVNIALSIIAPIGVYFGSRLDYMDNALGYAC